MKRDFPRLVIAAPSSDAGKTTVSIGLMRALLQKGRLVQPYKTGPDYIDTAYYTRLCNRDAANLDSYLLKPERLRELFAARSRDADISVIEGVMGLYDGIGATSEASTAQAAKILEAPVILVIHARGMALSAAAAVQGFQRFDETVNIAGVIFNAVGGEHHYQLLKTAVEENCGVPCLGYLPRVADIEIPSRHLGILPVCEMTDADGMLSKIGQLAADYLDIEGICRIAERAPALELPEPAPEPAYRCRIAIARDDAFHFYYADGLDALRQAGGQLIPFSPLADRSLPDCDGVYIGGGFPEMFANRLEANEPMRRSIYRAAGSGMPIYGECGGYMYLCDAIVSKDDERFRMCGILSGEAVLQKRLPKQFGYIEARLNTDTWLGGKGASFRAHEFHHSLMDAPASLLTIQKAGSSASWQCGQTRFQTIASYAHMHFAGETGFARRFTDACVRYAAERSAQ